MEPCEINNLPTKSCEVSSTVSNTEMTENMRTRNDSQILEVSNEKRILGPAASVNNNSNCQLHKNIAPSVSDPCRTSLIQCISPNSSSICSIQALRGYTPPPTSPLVVGSNLPVSVNTSPLCSPANPGLTARSSHGGSSTSSTSTINNNSPIGSISTTKIVPLSICARRRVPTPLSFHAIHDIFYSQSQASPNCGLSSGGYSPCYLTKGFPLSSRDLVAKGLKFVLNFPKSQRNALVRESRIESSRLIYRYTPLRGDSLCFEESGPNHSPHLMEGRPGSERLSIMAQPGWSQPRPAPHESTRHLSITPVAGGVLKITV